MALGKHCSPIGRTAVPVGLHFREGSRSSMESRSHPKPACNVERCWRSAGNMWWNLDRSSERGKEVWGGDRLDTKTEGMDPFANLMRPKNLFHRKKVHNIYHASFRATRALLRIQDYFAGFVSKSCFLPELCCARWSPTSSLVQRVFASW